ncbi:facilitated trehalose transporter Tret1-like [Epargyreus clarus]|uniref:facilitated trehalose transporter Tret1-like n=1 Tax=Epargyreus clarus TaxID=520877 RepID=UPI003C2DF0F6
MSQLYSANFQQVFWVIITTCSKVEAILTAMFLSGLSGSIFLIVPIYIGEICQPSIRGTMISVESVFTTIGMLTAYFLGGVLDYATMNYVCLALAVIEVLLLNLLKESPMFLMKNGAETEAAKVVAYYRGVDIDSIEVYEEMELMRKTLNPDFEVAIPEEEKLKPDSHQKLSVFQYLKRSRATRRGLAVSLMLYTATVCQGLIPIQVNAVPMFEAAVPEMSAAVASMLLAVVSMIAVVLSTGLVDKLGRRSLMIYSSIGGLACCVAVGTQIQFHWAPNWLTPLSIYIFCLMYFCGAGTVPYVVIAEIFLPEVRSYMSMLALEWGFTCTFVIVFIFNPMVTAVGLGPVFYLFGTICLMTAVFSSLFLPETKGLTVDVIQTKFEKHW